MSVFRNNGISALLSLESANGSIADSCLLPLREVPTEEGELIFEPDNASAGRVSLGAVQQLQPEVAIFRATLPDSFPVPCGQTAAGKHRGKPAPDGRLLLNQSVIATVKEHRFRPVIGPMLELRESGEHLASIESLTAPQPMEIALKRDDGTIIRHPLLEVRRRLSADILRVEYPPRRVIAAVLQREPRTR